MLAQRSARPALGAMWLNRESDVVAHLFFAAAEIGSVTLQIGGEEVRATITFPRTDERHVVMVIEEEMLVPFRPLPGAVVRVSYARGSSSYAWLTSVADTAGPRRWILHYPATIERSERRIVDRHVLDGREGFGLCAELGDGYDRLLQLTDISTAGLGFIVPRGAPPLPEGVELDCVLTLPDGSVVEVCAEVANRRPVGGGSKETVVGCRFVGLSSSGQARIAGSLARLVHPES